MILRDRTGQGSYSEPETSRSVFTRARAHLCLRPMRPVVFTKLSVKLTEEASRKGQAPYFRTSGRCDSRKSPSGRGFCKPLRLVSCCQNLIFSRTVVCGSTSLRFSVLCRVYPSSPLACPPHTSPRQVKKSIDFASAPGRESLNFITREA
jgi:hypothetical protein